MTPHYSFSLSAEVPSGEAEGAFHPGAAQAAECRVGMGACHVLAGAHVDRVPRQWQLTLSPPSIAAPCADATPAVPARGEHGAAHTLWQHP